MSPLHVCEQASVYTRSACTVVSFFNTKITLCRLDGQMSVLYVNDIV
jgi:hypothetical protein